MNEIFDKRDKIEMEVDETLIKQLKFIGLIQQIIGILGMIGGGIMCLTIIGAAAGIPYIMGALNVFKSGGSFGDTSRNNSGECLKEAIASLAKGMKLLLIGIVIWIGLYIFFFLIMMMIAIFAASLGY